MAKSVVLVEDEINTIELIRLNLEMKGLKVLVARDGVTGLEMIRKERPDGVVLDIKLPKMTGYEICATMQEDDDLKRIPIMIVTGLVEGNSPVEDAKWRERLNVADFVSKPFQPSEFAERVVKMME
jgi:CheY-like chemotaxis protein